VIVLEDKDYILIQRAIFKKYNAQSLVVYQILTFNKMCAAIEYYKHCEIKYSTLKEIIKIVRKYTKECELPLH